MIHSQGYAETVLHLRLRSQGSYAIPAISPSYPLGGQFAVAREPRCASDDDHLLDRGIDGVNRLGKLA